MKKILVGAITIGVILGCGSSFAAADELDSISKNENTIQSISASTTKSITTNQFNKVYAAMKNMKAHHINMVGIVLKLDLIVRG